LIDLIGSSRIRWRDVSLWKRGEEYREATIEWHITIITWKEPNNIEHKTPVLHTDGES
jgi:hypothetical protein